MLRIFQQSSVSGAQAYYASADYYTEGQEIAGQWRGMGAERLGLAGEIRKEDWDQLCANIDPATGKRLTKFSKSNRRVGYDLNWHVPKSVSLLYALHPDERIVEALRESVAETMADIEAEVETRVRKGRKDHDRTTGNLIWGEFVHTTGRPVNGIPDPHLHLHAFVMNATFDDVEGRWKAVQLGTVKSDAPYWEGCFHVRLAAKLADLGLPIERTRTRWMLKGVEMSALPKFSRRTALIEAEARRRGIFDQDAKSELGAKTREKKDKEYSFAQLRTLWDGMLDAKERASLQAVAARLGGPAVPLEEKDAPQVAVDYAIQHVFERKAVVRERVLLAHALKQAAGSARLETVLTLAKGAKLLRATLGGRSMVSTPEVLAEEQAMLAFAKEGRDAFRPFAAPDAAFKQTFLSPDQKRVVRAMLASTDGITIMRGVSGTGKTTVMVDVVNAIEAGGQKVFAFAPAPRRAGWCSGMPGSRTPTPSPSC
ncbi:MAG: MobF family relaxase [Tepidisphaeraceae bacterium]